MPTDPKALIEEARRLDAEATKGPWDTERQWHHEMASEPFVGEVWTRENILGCASLLMCEHERDAPFIARSRTLLPELADALEAALRREQRVRAVITKNERADSAPTIDELRAALGDSDGE